MQNKSFNYEEALAKLKAGQPITGADGVLTPLLKQMAEALLEGEVDAHLESDPEPNRPNGKSRKQVKCGSGSFELETPRDRAGTFEPQLVKKKSNDAGK